MLGVYLAFAGLHGVVEVYGVLGGYQGRDVREETISLLLFVLFLVWNIGRKCE